jgi:hypothetical protein
MTIIAALQLANALLGLIPHLVTAIKSIHEAIAAADAEGRDLTPEEVAAAIATRDLAMAQLSALLTPPAQTK